MQGQLLQNSNVSESERKKMRTASCTTMGRPSVIEPGNCGWAAYVDDVQRRRTEETDIACAARTERVDEANNAGARRFAHHTSLRCCARTNKHSTDAGTAQASAPLRTAKASLCTARLRTRLPGAGLCPGGHRASAGAGQALCQLHGVQGQGRYGAQGADDGRTRLSKVGGVWHAEDGTPRRRSSSRPGRRRLTATTGWPERARCCWSWRRWCRAAAASPANAGARTPDLAAAPPAPAAVA